MTTRKYVGLVCDLNERMAQMPPLFQENQQLDDSEFVESLANKVPLTIVMNHVVTYFGPK